MREGGGEVVAEGGELSPPRREPQPWDSWPRAKEEEPEYATAQMNLEEIEKDLEEVEAGLEAAAGESIILYLSARNAMSTRPTLILADLLRCRTRSTADEDNVDARSSAGGGKGEASGLYAHANHSC